MKVKEKTSSMKRPNAILHMVLWGFGSGTILALLYIGFIVGLDGADVMEMLGMVFNLGGLGLVFGGGAGAILGLMDGLILWGLSQNLPIPFSRGDMDAIRYKIYGAISIPTILGGFVLTSFAFGTSWFYYMSWLLVIPPIIAGIAAAYAAHRYLFRLRLWSERNYGQQKEKVKNVERLEDKPKHEDSYDEGKTENRQHKTS